MTAKTSITLTMNERVNEMWARGETVYHLGFGESRFPVHPSLLDALRANATHKAYPPVRGLPSLREAIAQFYQGQYDRPVGADQVMVGPGSKILLWASIQALEGDLILPQPSWVSYAPQAHMAGKQVLWLPTAEANDYIPTVEDLSTYIRRWRQAGANPRIILFNTPNNPTGVVYPPEAVKTLAEYAREHGLTIISDEIYALVNHGNRPYSSFYQYYPEGTIVTTGLSKHVSLGGWRFGLALVPMGAAGKTIMSRMSVIASETWSGASVPVQHAAVVAYRGDPDLMDYVKTCAHAHGAMACYLHGQLRRAGVTVPEPSGAFYVFPNFEAWRPGLAAIGVKTSEDLATYLLEQRHIATLPGTAFGDDPTHLTLRLATSYVDAQTDADAERLLTEFRRQPDAHRFIQEQCPNLVAVGQEFVALGKRLGQL